MGLIKCPRCELNYIQENEKCCNVCRRGTKDEPESEELVICPECGENPVVRGRELCASCLKEHLRQQKLDSLADAAENGDDLELAAVDGLEEMEEIDVALQEDIPESEYDEIDREFGTIDDEEPVLEEEDE